MLDKFPDEILHLILSHLPSVSLYFCLQVNKRLREASRHQKLWENLCFVERSINFKPKEWSWRKMFLEGCERVCWHLNVVQPKQQQEIFINSFKNMQNTEPLRCEGNTCLVELPDLWMCMKPGCNYVGCGRLKQGHAEEHWKEFGHELTLKLNTLEIWCYCCEKWIGIVGCSLAEYRMVEELTESLLPFHKNSHQVALNRRRQREREIVLCQYDDFIYFVNGEWISRWRGFLLGNEEIPGKIDNAPLLINGKVDPQLILWDEAFLVSPSTWEFLKETYGAELEISQDDIQSKEYAFLRAALQQWRIQSRPRDTDDEDEDWDDDEDVDEETSDYYHL
ncbi:Ubiquitin carboxyl-terminal hydrolase 33 [Basidiobolus ranarum]|uniref:Ubiquitin carboxyl-terminal hydrolase 33 n=1 Tax=Basidiobolus ranarum TaxID=34480 RepID=A0ABR2WQM4_9FUNG